MKKWIFASGLMFLSATALFTACKKDDKKPVETTNNFDRGAMLTNYADGYILPAYSDMTQKLQALQEQVNSFTADPTDARLTTLQAAWRTAYITWQKVDMLEFGPGEDVSLRMYINTHPATASKINSNVASGTYNLEQFGNKDAQGFPAVDYLINGIGSRQEIIAAYTTDAQATACKQYLKDVVAKMQEKVSGVNTAWATYKGTFTQSTGTDAGSSLSKMVNSYVLYYERYLRSGKIGLPLGAMTGVAAPQLTEAYYTPDLSKELALTALRSVKNFYEGKSYDGATDGQGLRDYMSAIGTKDNNGKLMSDVIVTEMDEATAALNGLNTTIRDGVSTNRTEVIAIYESLQQVVPVLKVDMVSALGISITYVDNDGD
ncbi:MAG: peptidase M75, Imelysin [Sphingobacteriales bacterium]|nr:MAG: peptidase M75, Imelysin [Sphingobacteriales bacterium]